MTPKMERDLNRLHQRVMQQLTWRQPRRQGCLSWDYPPLDVAMAEAGFEEIRTYVTRRHNAVAHYIAT